MKTIDTYINEMSVEIDEKVYAVAAKTIETAEKLMDAAKRMDGQPEYKLWLAEMEVLLGKAAVKEIFPNGRKENLDRMYRIYCGVIEAFEYNAEQVNSEKLEAQQDKIAGVTDMLKQLITAANIGETNRPDIVRRK
jgi:hypothetical protein